MEIRRLAPGEMRLKRLVDAVCYLDYEPEDPHGNSGGREDVWGAFDDGGNLCSGLAVWPFTMMFHRKPVLMGGVGGVASLPEARNRGHVRALFKNVLEDMREQRQAFSVVRSPFSHAYYRKFGYEHVYTRSVADIPMEALSGYPFPDNIKPYAADSPFREIMDVYAAFVQNKNLAIVRSESDWRRLLDRDPYARREFTYLHRGANGRADAYIMYKPEKGDGSRLIAEELAWSEPAGLWAMLGFVHGLRTEFSGLRWTVPDSPDVFALFPEAWDVSVRREPAGMLRIVDLPRALAALDAPATNGRAVLDVRDGFCPWNTGKYAVEWEDGVLSVHPSAERADVVTDIAALAQFVAGYVSPAESAYKREGASVRSGTKALAALFPKRPMYMMEDF